MRFIIGSRYLCRIAPWKTICVLVDKLENSVVVKWEGNTVQELQVYEKTYFKESFELWKGK